MGQTREFSVPRSYELTDDHLLPRAPWQQAEKNPDLVVVERPVDGSWVPMTAKEFLGNVLDVSRGLVADGLEPGDRVALMADTSYEWLLLDLAIWNAGCVTVPIYPSSSAGQVEWILQDSGARAIFVGGATQESVAQEAGVGTPCFRMDSETLRQLVVRGESVSEDAVRSRLDALTLDQPASIIYTSGTTGRPKGCVISHRNAAAEVQALLRSPIGQQCTPGRKMIMFLPLAHVLARAVTYTGVVGGATLGFWGDFKTIADQFASFKPHILLGVPRVFEKVRAGVRTKAHKGGPVKAEIFRRAEASAVKYAQAENPGRFLQWEHKVFDKLVYAKVREAMGGNVLFAISGGGALNPRLGNFFEGLGVPIYEGYGLTETFAAITVNQPGANRVGTVGQLIAGHSARLSESGELQLKGDVVFEGYFRNDEATEAAFEDGWFKTGDLASIDDDGYVKITGRAKEIIVTAGGKNVAPGPMEDMIRENPLIGHAMLVGEGRPFVTALLTLDPENAPEWAQERGLSLHDLPKNDEFRALVQASIDEANATVSSAEGVKKYWVLQDDFTEESGELTPTMKIKRHVVAKKHHRAIEHLYKR